MVNTVEILHKLRKISCFLLKNVKMRRKLHFPLSYVPVFSLLCVENENKEIDMVYFIWWLILTFLYLGYYTVVLTMDVNAKKKAALKSDKAQVIASPENEEADVEEVPVPVVEKEDAAVINGIPIHKPEDEENPKKDVKAKAETDSGDEDTPDDAFKEKLEKAQKDAGLQNIGTPEAANAMATAEMMGSSDDDDVEYDDD